MVSKHKSLYLATKGNSSFKALSVSQFQNNVLDLVESFLIFWKGYKLLF